MALRTRDSSVGRTRSIDRKSAIPVRRRSRSADVNFPVESCTPLVREGSTFSLRSCPSTSKKLNVRSQQFPIGDKDFRAVALTVVRNYFFFKGDQSLSNIDWSTFGSKPLTVDSYIQMFNSLFREIICTINLNLKNYLEQLPPCMKRIGYPGSVQKSWLIALNTKNSWPNVLGILSYLVDLNNTLDESVMCDTVSEDPIITEIESLKFQYMFDFYEAWNDDNEKMIKDIDDNFERSVRALFPVDEDKFKKVVSEIEALETRLASSDFPIVRQKLETVEEKQKSTKSKHERIELEIKKIKDLSKERERNFETNKQKILSLDDYIRRKRSEIERLKVTCQNQEISVEEERKCQNECSECREKIRRTEALISSLRESCYSSDLKLTNTKAKLDDTYTKLKILLCEKSIDCGEIKVDEINPKMTSEDWQVLLEKVDNIRKQLTSKCQTLKMCSQQRAPAVAQLSPELERLKEAVKDANNQEIYLKEIVNKLTLDDRENHAKDAEKRNEINKKKEKIDSKLSEINSIKNRLKCYKDKINLVTSTNKQNMKKYEEMKENLTKKRTEMMKYFIIEILKKRAESGFPPFRIENYPEFDCGEFRKIVEECEAKKH